MEDKATKRQIEALYNFRSHMSEKEFAEIWIEQCQLAWLKPEDLTKRQATRVLKLLIERIRR